MPYNNNVVEFPVFKDRYGNRFVFPTVHNKNENLSGTGLWSWCRYAEVALDVVEEDKRFEVELDAEGYVNFTHVVTICASRGFKDGGETVWMIGGPEFDSFIARGASE